MATVSFQLATFQQPFDPGSTQSSVSLSPQNNMAQPQIASVPQDAVTLVGRTAENQSNHDAAGGGVGAEAYFNAESQSFRAGNGSAQSQAVQSMPVHIKDEAILSSSQGQGQSAGSKQNQVQSSNSGPAAIATTNINSVSTISATGQPNVAETSSAAASTPQQQLQQLDQTLQEIGINPQSIALFNRMAMLLYANDPAALKVLVQVLQNVTPQLSVSNTDGNLQTSATQGEPKAQARLLAAPDTQLLPAEPSRSGDINSGATYTNIGSTNLEVSQNALGQTGSTTPSQPSNSGSSQPIRISSDLLNFQRTLAAIGSQTDSENETIRPTEAGQALDITA